MLKQHSKLFFFLLFFTATIQQSYAYQLFGYKWASENYNFYINTTGVDDNLDYSSYSSTVINAAKEWETVTTSNISINCLGTTSNNEWGINDGQNIVTWKTDDWSGSVIGISTAWYSGNEIIDSDIKLNTAFATDSRLSQLVMHEVGHSLGIGHTRESGESYTDNEYNAIMYWQLHSQTNLNQEDRCAITAIYPSSSSCSPTDEAGYFECSACCSGDYSVDVNFTNTSQTYSGKSKSITITTDPEDISYSTTYTNQDNQTISSPTDAGTYTATVTITESGYEETSTYEHTLTINKKSLSVSADNKTVDYGDNQPTYSLSYSGFVNNEDQSALTTAPSAFILNSWPLDSGTYIIYANLGVDNNYSFNYTNGTLIINPLTVNEVLFSNLKCCYNGTNKTISVSTTPSDIDYTITYTLDEQATNEQIDAGIYAVSIAITETGFTHESYDTIMTISKALLSVIADNQSIQYGDAEPEYPLTFSGFLNGENQSVLDSIPVASIDEIWPLPAGDYVIKIAAVDDNNYTIATTNGTLTVNALKVDSVKYSNTLIVYDGLIHEPYITTYPNNLDYQLSYYTENNDCISAPSQAGNYHTKVTIKQEGYTPDVFESTFTIKKAPLAIVIQNDSITYGETVPDLIYSFSGFVNNETSEDLFISDTDSQNLAEIWDAGTYTRIPQDQSSFNYSISYTPGILFIQKAMLTITPLDTTINYNDTFPELSYTITGFVNNENEEAIRTLPVFKNEFESPLYPGTYPIEMNDGETNNYDFRYNTGLLTVNAIAAEIIATNIDTVYTGLPYELSVSTNPSNIAYTIQYDKQPLEAGTYQAIISLDDPGYSYNTQTIDIVIQKAHLIATTEDKEALWGDNEPTYNINITGFVNNENESLIDQMPTVSTSKKWPIEAGVYSLVIDGGDDNNYIFSYINGTLSVIQTYQIKINASENGWVSIGEQGEIKSFIEERIIINASSSEFHTTPDEGYTFQCWSNGQTETPLTLYNIQQDSSITAIFETKVNSQSIFTNASQMKAYPNPASPRQTITIQTNLTQGINTSAVLTISNVLGKIITKIDNVGQENFIHIQSKGLYTVVLRTPEGESTYLKLLIK